MRGADEVLERVFAAVVAKAREDRRFAERLIEALGREVALARPKRAAPPPATIPPALASLDLAALIRAEGKRKAQRFLEEGGFTVAQLRAFAEAQGISLRGEGRRKSAVIAALLRAHAPSRADAFG